MFINNYITKFVEFLDNPIGATEKLPHSPDPLEMWEEENSIPWEQRRKPGGPTPAAFVEYEKNFYSRLYGLSPQQMDHQIFKRNVFAAVGVGALTISAINCHLIRKDHKDDSKENQWKGSKALLVATSTVAAICISCATYMAFSNTRSKHWRY